LLKDEDGEEVDVHLYRSMIGSLMYLTSSRPDIMFAVCACARYQVNPKVSHLHAVKRIFRYLKGQSKLGLWYPKDFPFNLVAYTDSDYTGASLDRKSTTGGCQFLGSRLISWQCKKQTVVINFITEAKYVAASSCYGQVKTINGEVQIQALVDGKNFIITESIVTRYLQLEDAKGADCLPTATIFEQLTLMGTTAWNEFSSTTASAIICLATNQKFNFSKYIFESMVKNLENVSGKFLMYPDNVADEAVYKELDDSLVRAATTASSLEAEQDSSNINKTRSKATLNKPNPHGTGSGVNTPRSGKDSMKLKELMEFYTKLQQRVLDVENTKTTQAQEITSLKLRVGRSARVVSSDEASWGDQENASKQGRKINDINKDAEITLVDETQGRYGDNLMFDTSDLAGEEVFVAEQGVPDSKKDDVVSIAGVATTVTKPKVKGIVFKEPVESTKTTISSQQPSQVKVQDKGKGKIVEPEKPMKKKELIRLDEEITSKLQVEFDEEVRLVKEKAEKEKEANIISRDNVQAMIDVDY
ncbi:hypothetical protein Tco_1171671, partial [Tanacetum coccineum]